MKKKIPKFETEDKEREFWESHDSIEYVDWEKAKRMKFPKLKPSTRTDSDLVTETARSGLAEDAEDLAAFEKREEEPNLRFEDVLEDLKQRGKI